MSVLRFFLYRVFKALAGMFIDREVKRHQARIFEVLDREMWRGGSGQSWKESAIKTVIMAATGLASVDERQVQQVRDLFDPLAFAKGEKR